MSKQISIFYFLICWCLWTIQVQGQRLSAQATIDTITSRLCKKILNERPDDAEVRNYVNAMAADGSWPDVVYVDTAMATWKPLAHLAHLKTMAIALCTRSSSFYKSNGLKEKILLGLKYYHQRKPEARNWWYRDIGAPQVHMVVLLLLKKGIDRKTLLHYSAVLSDATGNPSHRGKNRSWVSEITIYKGCIEDDVNLIARGFNSIASTLAVDTAADGEGIKVDYSFHQHHAQLYSGGYGLSLMSDYADFILLARNTLFAELFTPEKRRIFENLLLNGHQRLSYRQTVDFGSIGRNISRPNDGETVPATLLEQMELINPTNKAAYSNWLDHRNGGPFPEAYRGNYHFWLSDIMTQHGANYYLSARIISKRTIGSESLNGENLKGYNLALGATNIKVTGNEYYNIYPVWDWSRVPGTTAELNEQRTHFSRYLKGNNAFGGGVSDGSTGVIAFMNEQQDINAHKAYFFIDDVLVCLGAGIRAAKDQPVVTSVNQCLSAGTIHTSAGKLTAGARVQQDLRWVHHGKVGYLFPVGTKVSVQNILQTGTWRSINTSGSADTVSEQIFSIWLNHGTQPTNAAYQYMVLPDRSLLQFKQLVAKNKLVVIKNESGIQAVYNGSDSYLIVFYKAGSIEIGKGMSLSADAPVLLLVKKVANGYRLAAADPLYAQKGVGIRINKKHSKTSEPRSEGRKLFIEFPAGVKRGSTVNAYYAQVP